jgi:hypothetical protein
MKQVGFGEMTFWQEKGHPGWHCDTEGLRDDFVQAAFAHWVKAVIRS